MNKTIFKIAKKIIFYIFFILIIYFFSKTLYQDFDSIENWDFSINYYYLFLSSFIYLVFFISLWVLWKYLLFNNLDKKSYNKKPSYRNLIYINSISWISKYLPWKVAMILTKVLYLKDNFWINKKTTFISCLYEHIFQIISSFLLSFPFIIYHFSGSENESYIYLSSISFVLLLIFIHPRVFNRVLNKLLKILKKDEVKKENFLSIFQIAKYLLWYSLSMIVKWLSFLFLVMSVISVTSIADISFFIFAWIFAWVIWIVSIFAPNWLWVREWVLVFLLQFIIWLEIAIIISVLSRLWFSLCDILIWAYVWYEKYIRK